MFSFGMNNIKNTRRLHRTSIVITGNPGVGKHTIAKGVAQELGLPILDINEIAMNADLLEENAETNDVDTEKLRELVREEYLCRKNMIVGHLAPYVCHKENIKIMIILRRDPYELLSVYKERGYSDVKTRDNVASEILGIIANDAKIKFQEKAFQINVSKKSIHVVVKDVVALISDYSKDSKNKEEAVIDWLELVKKNNDLKKFFVD